MGDLFDITVTVSTPGAPLELNDHAVCELVEWNPPIQLVRRVTSTGPYQSGRRLITATRDALTLTAVIRVLGADWAACAANTESVFSALSQFAYTITETVEGVTRVFDCEPADITLDGGLDGFQVARGRHEFVLTIPCNPPSAVEGS